MVGSYRTDRSAFRLGIPLAGVAENLFVTAGRVAGLFAGIAMAIFDIYHTVVEIRLDGDGVLIGAYFASAVVGGALSLVMFIGIGAASLPVIGILVLLLIVIGVWIENNKGNPVQDWLERCPWGNLTSERYKDLATEQAELMKAIED